MSEYRQEFMDICEECIKRNGISELVTWLSEADFFTAPASTKYHGSHEGGLIKHSLKVYNVLREAVTKHGFSDIYNDETVAIVSLFHDICKVNLYVKGFRNVKENGQWIQKEVYETDERFPCGDHADKSIIILQNFIKLKPEEILAIRAHMGGWDNAAKGGSYFINRIFERSKLAVLLHLADMEATYIHEVN